VLSIIKVFSLEELLIIDPVLINSRVMVMPTDLFMFNVFILIHMTKTEYIGRNNYDYWQYFGLRVLPFVSLFTELIMIDQLQ